MREDWIEILYKDAVYKISTTKQKLKQKEYSQFGEYPIVDQGQDKIGGYSGDKDRILDCKLPVVVFGDHTKCVKLINFKFIPGADGTKVLEPKLGIEPKYISILTHVLVHKIKDKGYARHYQYIEMENLPLAPLPEQRAIVAKIEELFTDLDKGIADLKKAQDQLKVYRQAVLKKAFEGELTNTQMTPRTLDSLTSIITKGASPKWQGFDYTTDSNQLLFVTSENVREGYISLEKEKYLPVGFNEVQKRSVLQKGDVLFNIVGASIGRAAIFELDKLSNINQAVALIRLDEEVLNQYVNYFLNSEGAKQEYLKKQVEVARANLSLQNVKDIEIPFCNVDKQRIVIQEIESRLSVCDKVEQSITESLEKSKALRQSILKKAFEGTLLSQEEIAKCKAAADYEPASVLLARIKKEKSHQTKDKKK